MNVGGNVVLFETDMVNFRVSRFFCIKVFHESAKS